MKKKITSKLKSYHIILLPFIITTLLIINSNYANKQKAKTNFFREKSQLFDLKTRILQGMNSTSSQDSNKICEKTHEELKQYYKTGDLEKIIKKDNIFTNEDENKAYVKALINIIKNFIDDKDLSEDKNKYLKAYSLNDDFKTYYKHILPIFIPLIVGILSLPAWIVYWICCCCNCCCCCCCKKPKCKMPLFILIIFLNAIDIAICIYMLIQSNSIFKGIADTKCSILKFFIQILEGETKEALPRWAGIDRINDILKDINTQIDNLRKGTLYGLNNPIKGINNKKIALKNKMEGCGNEFYSSPSRATYKNLYSNNYVILSRGISGRYVLDLVKFFGKKVIDSDEDEEKYEPQNSILDLWHQEYKLISKKADNYLEEAMTNLKTISDDSIGDVVGKFEEVQENLKKIKEFFNGIKMKIEEYNLDIIDKYGNLGFILFFCILGSINIICLFRLLIHLFWNMQYLLMILSFFIGFIFIFVGTVGNDITSAISIIVSEENFGEGIENIIFDQLGKAKDYLYICINGNGSIIDLLNIDISQLDAFDNLKIIEEQINEIRNEFQERKNFTTYSFYIEQLKERINLSVMPLLIKDTYEIKLPISETQSYEYQADIFLKFDIELRIMNNLIRTQEKEPYKNEQWKINSISSNKCGAGIDPVFYSSEFNPLKCRPWNRDWIQTTLYSDIKKEAQIISDTLTFLDNSNIDEDPQSFIYILNDLKSVYNDYLEQYIITLDIFKIILNKIIGKIKQNINSDDTFSFMNGKFIGTNLKIILIYLKKALGKDLKKSGIILIVVGMTLALSIFMTILLNIIINIIIEINRKAISVPVVNTSLPFKSKQAIQEQKSKKSNPKDKTKHPTQTEENRKKRIQKVRKLKPLFPLFPQGTNKYIIEATKFLIEGCNISPTILDEKGNSQSGWRIGKRNGPKGYLKDYYPPEGWTGIGLKVASLYDHGNNDWLGNDNSDGEWYIGYHGVKTIEAIHGICNDGFRRGDGQLYKDSDNINPLTNKQYPKCGEGVYLTNEINEASKYTKPINYKGNKYRVVFMCRVNPYKVRIADIGNNKEYWIVDGDKPSDLYGIKRSDVVRPYRILVLKI